MANRILPDAAQKRLIRPTNGSPSPNAGRSRRPDKRSASGIYLDQRMQQEEVRIKRKDGSIFILRAEKEKPKSPFDVPGIKTQATTQDILETVRESRAR
jgi:hypothetical protein